MSKNFNKVNPKIELYIKCKIRWEITENIINQEYKTILYLSIRDRYITGRDIVCSNECNVAATVINKINKDKRNNGKTGKISREKIQNQISAFNKRNNQYDENNDEDNNPNQN